MSIGSKVENALHVKFEFSNVVRLNVGHSEFRTHPPALVKLTLSTSTGNGKASVGESTNHLVPRDMTVMLCHCHSHGDSGNPHLAIHYRFTKIDWYHCRFRRRMEDSQRHCYDHLSKR